LTHAEIDAQVDVAKLAGGADCYLPKHSANGWCYTEEDDDDDDQRAANSSKPWGFCYAACGHKVRQGSNSNLREVSLDVLDAAKCNTKKKTIDENKELCIARVLRKPAVGVFDSHFQMVDLKSDGHYDFVGYQDACQGDSGGPYYLFEKDQRGRKRATMVGLVSRGNGCADKNEPGKATRIKSFLSWITEQTGTSAAESTTSSNRQAMKQQQREQQPREQQHQAMQLPQHRQPYPHRDQHEEEVHRYWSNHPLLGQEPRYPAEQDEGLIRHYPYHHAGTPAAPAWHVWDRLAAPYWSQHYFHGGGRGLMSRAGKKSDGGNGDEESVVDDIVQELDDLEREFGLKKVNKVTRCDQV